MKQLISTLKSAMGILLCCVSLIACTEDDLAKADTDYGKPIRLFVSGPDDNHISTARTIKETFANGDGIHIQADFTLDGKVTKTVYSFLTYQNGTWKEKDTETFNWPWNAVKASFTAYYIPGRGQDANSDKLDSRGITLSLSDLSKEGNDPLMATCTEVVAGSSVYLQFAHLLSKVTFTALKSVTDGEELRLIVTEEGVKVNAIDTWKIELAKEGQTEKLKVTKTTTTGYIAHKATNAGETVTFLVPVSPAKTNLRLANKQMSILHAFDLPESLTKGLEAGKHYTINASKLHDNFVSSDINEEQWNTDAAITLTPDEIGSYLKGVSEGQPFSVIRDDKSIQILVTYSESNKSIVAQIRDVDFDNQQFTPPAQVYQTITFYGNNHYIKNVNLQQIKGNSKAIFSENRGSIQDLIIENVKTENNTTAETHLGILAGINEGTMKNIRLKGTISLTAGPDTQYIGSLVGLNNKTVQNCSVSGNLSIKVTHSKKETLSVGGMVGYTTGDDSKLDNCQIEVTNTEGGVNGIIASGESEYNAFIGGMTGQNTEYGQVSNCQTNLPLTIQKSAHIYAGGMVGMASATLYKCTAVSDITCSATDTETITIGGFVGTQRVGKITNCVAIGSISGTFQADSKAGGFAGNINPNNAGTTLQFTSATGKIADNIAGMVGMIEPNGQKVTIDNSFCWKGVSFTKAMTTAVVEITISNCHINGKVPGNTNNFIPSGDNEKYWTIEPPIYGANVYYLKH